jgi:hypothetical protein
MKYIIFLSVLWLLVIANVFRSSPIPVTFTMEAICSLQTSVLTRTTQRNIPGDGIIPEEWCLLGCYAVWLL